MTDDDESRPHLDERHLDWYIEAERALGEEPPAPDADEFVTTAFHDRLITKALELGLLEKEVYRPRGPGPMTLIGIDGVVVSLEPGIGAFYISPSGQPTWAVLADQENMPADPDEP